MILSLAVMHYAFGLLLIQLPIQSFYEISQTANVKVALLSSYAISLLLIHTPIQAFYRISETAKAFMALSSSLKLVLERDETYNSFQK